MFSKFSAIVILYGIFSSTSFILAADPMYTVQYQVNDIFGKYDMRSVKKEGFDKEELQSLYNHLHHFRLNSYINAERNWQECEKSEWVLNQQMLTYPTITFPPTGKEQRTETKDPDTLPNVVESLEKKHGKDVVARQLDLWRLEYEKLIEEAVIEAWQEKVRGEKK